MRLQVLSATDWEVTTPQRDEVSVMRNQDSIEQLRWEAATGSQSEVATEKSELKGVVAAGAMNNRCTLTLSCGT